MDRLMDNLKPCARFERKAWSLSFILFYSRYVKGGENDKRK